MSAPTDEVVAFATAPVLDDLPVRHLADFVVHLADPEVIAGPRGMRMTYIATGGTVRGERFNAEILPGGGDWIVVGSDYRPRLDIRATLHAEDGSLVHLSYPGVIDAPRELLAELAAGGSIAEEDMYARIAPKFETSAEHLAWLSTRVFVGYAALAPGRITYRVHEVL